MLITLKVRIVYNVTPEIDAQMSAGKNEAFEAVEKEIANKLDLNEQDVEIEDVN